MEEWFSFTPASFMGLFLDALPQWPDFLFHVPLAVWYSLPGHAPTSPLLTCFPTAYKMAHKHIQISYLLVSAVASNTLSFSLSSAFVSKCPERCMSGYCPHKPSAFDFCTAWASCIIYHVFLCLLSLVTACLTFKVQHRHTPLEAALPRACNQQAD